MKAIIIDDEARARNSLKILLENFAPDIDVLGEASDIDNGFKEIILLKPDLVFLDIEMPPKTGFDLLERFSTRTFEVIFITAYSEFGIQAIKAEALDYVVKPIIAEELVAALERVRRKSKASRKAPNEEKLSLSDSNGVYFQKIADIIRCESDKNYTTIYLKDGSKKVVSKTLKEFDDVLGQYGFSRVHHSHLVNMSEVRSFERVDGGTLFLSDGSQVLVSRRKKDALLKLLRNYNSVSL